MSQRYIASKLGFTSRSIISDWEQGKAFPMGDDLLRLSIIYQTTPCELYPEYMEELQRQILQENLELLTNV